MKSIRTLGLVGLLLLTSCGSTSSGTVPGASATPLEKVKLATLAPSSLLWLHQIAVEKSFYAAQGVEVEVIQVASSSALVQAVSSGSADAGVSLGDDVMAAVDKGAPIKMVGGILNKAILRLVSAKSATSGPQLNGKNVTAGQVAGGTADLMLFQLKNLGVNQKSVKLVSIANSGDRITALRNDQVAAALLIAPFDVQAINEGFHLLDVYKQPFVETPLIVNTNWAKDHKRAATGLTHAFREAAQWVDDSAHRKEAVDILARYVNVKADVADASYQFVVVEQQAIPKDLAIQEAGLTNILKIRSEIEGIPYPAFRLGDYYEPSYLKTT